MHEHPDSARELAIESGSVAGRAALVTRIADHDPDIVGVALDSLGLLAVQRLA